MNKKLILFDYDGTIVNSELAILNGIKYALSYFNYPSPTDEILRNNIGKPLLPLFAEYTDNSDRGVLVDDILVIRGIAMDAVKLTNAFVWVWSQLRQFIAWLQPSPPRIWAT